MAAMPTVPIITLADLAPFAQIEASKAQAMIEDATAMAVRVAPCLADPEFNAVLAARAILRGAILRWNDAGSGAVTHQSAGPFQQIVDTRADGRRGLFWPSELSALQELCTEAGPRAFTVDPTPQPAYDSTGHWATPDHWVPEP